MEPVDAEQPFFCPSGELPMRDTFFARAAGRLTEGGDARECQHNFVLF